MLRVETESSWKVGEGGGQSRGGILEVYFWYTTNVSETGVGNKKKNEL